MDISDKIRQLWRENDKQAFRLIYDSFRDPLFLFSLRMIGDPEAAEDVVHDCLSDFWIHNRIEKIKGDIPGYLYGSVHLASLYYIRKAKRQRELYNRAGNELRSSVSDSDPDTQDTVLIKHIYECVEKLPEDRRRVFKMVILESMKYQKVADDLGISLNTVKTQMKRALATLRSSLDKKN